MDVVQAGGSHDKITLLTNAEFVDFQETACKYDKGYTTIRLVLCLLTVRVVGVEELEDLWVLSKVEVIFADILNLLGYGR